MTTDQLEETFEDQTEALASGDDKDVRRVYEVGYHIIPTVSEEGLEKEIASITAVLKKENVDFVGERVPALIQLAYSLEHIVGGVKNYFDTAFFGWIAFEASPASIAAIDAAMKTHENVLRHIIIKTTRETVAATMADPGLDVGAPKPEIPEEDGDTTVDGDDSAPEEKEAA